MGGCIQTFVVKIYVHTETERERERERQRQIPAVDSFTIERLTPSRVWGRMVSGRVFGGYNRQSRASGHHYCSQQQTRFRIPSSLDVRANPETQSPKPQHTLNPRFPGPSHKAYTVCKMCTVFLMKLMYGVGWVLPHSVTVG